MSKYILLLVIWGLTTILALEGAYYCINYSNTLLNIAGVLIIAIYSIISLKTVLFTKNPFKKK